MTATRWADDDRRSARGGRDRARGLDDGSYRVAERDAGGTAGQPMAEKGAVLLSFRPRHGTDRRRSRRRAGGTRCRRNSPAGARIVSATRASAPFPVRSSANGAHIAKGAVLLPSFVNIGARVGEGSMVDAWATVGSCGADRRERPSVGRRGDRRRIGTAAGRARGDRGRRVHRRARRSRRGRDRA